MNKKDNIICRYNTRAWLNRENSRNTGSIVCYDGEMDFSDGRGRDSFVEIADCHGKVRLHKSAFDSEYDWIEKLTLLRNNIDLFICFLKSQYQKK